MAGFWSIIYEPLNKKILNYRSYKYATFNCLSKCLNFKPIFLPLSFNRDPDSSKSCYSRHFHRTLWFEIKEKRNQPTWASLVCFSLGVCCSNEVEGEKPQGWTSQKRGSMAVILNKEVSRGKYEGWQRKKGRKSTRATCPWPFHTDDIREAANHVSPFCHVLLAITAKTRKSHEYFLDCFFTQRRC